MAFPLDKQSKFMALLNITDFFILVGMGCFNLFLAIGLLYYLHLRLTSVLFICFSWFTVATVFILLKNHYPPNFFINRFAYSLSPKRYLPIPEPEEFPDESN